MSGEINNRIYDNPLKTSGKYTSDNVKTSQNGTTGNSGSIFSFKHDAKISQNQLGTKEETEFFFKEFDLDGDGLISARNTKGVNELELLNKRYEEIKNDRSATKPPSSNPVVKMYNKVVNFFKNDTGKEVYRDGEIIAAADGNIDEAFQSETLGDCWLLSRISAMSNTDFGIEAIKEAIGENKIVRNDDGSYTINIKRIGEKYTFTRDEIQAAIDSNKYSKGDLDVLLLELAFEKHYDQILDTEKQQKMKEGKLKASSENKIITSSIHGGLTGNYYTGLHDFNNKDIISIITGSEHLYASTDEEKNAVLNLKSEYPRDIAITFSSAYAIELDEEGNVSIEKFDPESNGGFETHAYELKSVIKDSDGNITQIIVVNPWNNKEEISLSKEDFEKLCIDIDFDTKNEDVIKKYNDINVKKNAQKLEEQNLKYLDINGILGNTKDIKHLSNTIGGLQGLHERYMSRVENDTRGIYEAYKKDGIEGMNEYIGYEAWTTDDKETYDMINEFMSKSHQERCESNIKTFYENLGFESEEINDLIQHPEKFEQYCNKHGYKY